MSPEQILNYRYVKPSSDIYSIGITLYYLLTSKFPFEYPTPLEVIKYKQFGKAGKILQKYMNNKNPKNPFFMSLEDSPIPIRKINPNIPKVLADIVDVP